MRCGVWLVALVVAGGAWSRAAGEAPAPRTIEVRQCLVALVDEAMVPAQEAGELVELAVTEGKRVAKGDVLGRINDDQPKLEKRRAKAELDQATAKAAADVDVRFATEAIKLAGLDLQKSTDARKASPGAVTEIVLREKELAVVKADLQKEQAETERTMARLAADVKQAEVEAADVAIERRVIRSPLDGIVLDVLKHRGEWMQPGEALTRVVRADQLLVKGHVPIREARQALVEGRPVRVTVELDGGRRETFAGRIVFASPEVTGGDYLVHADVENRQVDGEWLLPAGLTATMTILLDEPAGPPPAR